MPKITYVLGRPTARTTQSTAAGQVQQVLGPQLAQQAAYGQHQNAVIQSFARSLLGKLQPVAGQVGADYDAAIKQIGGLSGQAAQFLSGQNPTASQQALTSAVGAPPAQQAQQAQQLSDTFQGGAGVLAFTGGTIPGSQLAGNKAAAQAQARTLPAIAALKGQQDLSSAMWQQSVDRQKLEATRPELVQKAQTQIDETRIANQKLEQQATANRATAIYRQTMADQGQQRIDLGYTKAQQSAYDKQLDREATKAYRDTYLKHLQAGDRDDAAHHAADEAATIVRNQIAQQRADISQQQADTSEYRAHHPAPSTTAPTTKKINGVTYQWDAKQQGWTKTGLPIEKPKPVAPKKVGGLTRPERLKYQGLALTLADQSFNGAPETKPGAGDELPAITYREAVLEGQKEGIPMEILIPALNRIYGKKEVGKLVAAIKGLSNIKVG